MLSFRLDGGRGREEEGREGILARLNRLDPFIESIDFPRDYPFYLKLTENFVDSNNKDDGI